MCAICIPCLILENRFHYFVTMQSWQHEYFTSAVTQNLTWKKFTLCGCHLEVLNNLIFESVSCMKDEMGQ